MPEGRWDEFLQLSGCEAEGDFTGYKGVTLKKAAVTAVVVEEGF